MKALDIMNVVKATWKGQQMEVGFEYKGDVFDISNATIKCYPRHIVFVCDESDKIFSTTKPYDEHAFQRLFVED